MTPREKDAIGRAILRELRSIEKYLYKLRAPESEVPDIALDAALLTYRKIAQGGLVLPTHPAEGRAVLAAYLRKVAFNLLRGRRRAGDIYVRAHRFDDAETARYIGTYTIAAKLELWSELRVQTPSVRRFLLALFSIGEVAATAKALRMTKGAADDVMSRARERAQGKRRPPRGKNRKRPKLPREAPIVGHPEACPCWRCAELRGEDDGLAPYRARAADPLTCPHPQDMRHPYSGDTWACGLCGADTDPPDGY